MLYAVQHANYSYSVPSFNVRHTTTPYLIGTALRLADACDVIDAVVGSAALQATELKSLCSEVTFCLRRGRCCLGVMQCRRTECEHKKIHNSRSLHLIAHEMDGN